MKEYINLINGHIQDKKHIVITGGRGSGKTTLINEIRNVFGQENFVTGLVTWAEPDRAVFVRELGTTESVMVGEFNPNRLSNENKMKPIRNGFEKKGVFILDNLINSDTEWVTIDEIGYLEGTCPSYLKKLNELDFTEEFTENIDAYATASKETGVIFPSLGMNIFCNNSYITKNSEGYFEQEIEKALKCASKLGIKTLQIPAFGVSDISNDEKLHMAAKNLRRACELAEEYGIYIGTENALDENDNKRLFQLVDHKLLCFYFDNQNLWRMTIRIQQLGCLVK